MTDLFPARTWTALAAAGSAALLGGALLFQYVGGLPPCDLCIEQRWPHLAAVVLGALALVAGRSLSGRAGAALCGLGALAAATTAAIGVYHTGVERGVWKGPETCTSSGQAAVSPDQLLDQIMAAPVTRCDEVLWQFLGLSMASWNALISLGLAILWVIAARAWLRHRIRAA